MSHDSPDPRDEAGEPLTPANGTAGCGPNGVPTRVAEPLLSPQQIGPYAVVSTLGRGGMSTVYLARDGRDGKDVALKVIPNGADADPIDLARFHAEAEAVARLHHPNIVRLYEVGEAAGVAYLAMEYLPGGNLYKRITRGGPLGVAAAARLVEPLARAAQYAHRHGVIHRDLKPSNILLSADRPGHDPVPKIADFGLARQLDKSLRLTRSGVALGTPHYMAPEQAHGHGDLVGPAADVYALGAILYECLTGHPPFGGASPLETMEQVVHKKPVPPRHLRDGIPPDLEAICLRCLEKSPDRRFPTAGALADALALFLAGKPVAPLDDRPTERIRGRGGWRPVSTVLAGAGLVLLTVLATWFLVGRMNRGRVESARTEAAAATRAERRAALEAAIARCERGDIRGGLERMRALGPDAALPIEKIVAAWETRTLRPGAAVPVAVANQVAVAASGRFVATATGDTLRIWSWPDGNPLGEPWRADGPVTALAWEDGGDRLAVGTAAGRVSVGDGSREVFAPTVVAEPNGSPVRALRLTRNTLRIARGSVLTIRTEADGQQPADTNVPDVGPLASVALGPQGAVAAATAEGAVKVYEPGGRRWLDLPPEGDASAIAYAADGNVIAVGTREGRVRLWDAVARTPLSGTAPLNGAVSAVGIGLSATEYTVVASGVNGTVAFTCPRPFVVPPVRLSDDPGQRVLGVAFAPGQTGLFITTPTGVSVWRVGAGGRYVRRGEHAAGRVTAASTHQAPSAPVVGGRQGRVAVVDAEQGRELAAGRVDGADEVTTVATGPQGQVLAGARAGDRRAVVGVWEGGIGASPGHVGSLDCEICQGVFVPDGTAVVLGCEDGMVRVWDPVTRQPVGPPLVCHSPVLAVTANDDQILAGCADGTAHLWDRQTGAELQVVRHRAAVRAVAFRGTDLLTAGGDGAVRRWDAVTGLPIGPPLRHPDAITALAIDNGFIATGGRDRHVRVWRLP